MSNLLVFCVGASKALWGIVLNESSLMWVKLPALHGIGDDDFDSVGDRCSWVGTPFSSNNERFQVGLQNAQVTIRGKREHTNRNNVHVRFQVGPRSDRFVRLVDSVAALVLKDFVKEFTLTHGCGSCGCCFGFCRLDWRGCGDGSCSGTSG